MAATRRGASGTHLGHFLEVVDHLLPARLNLDGRDILRRVRVDVINERRKRRAAFRARGGVDDVGACAIIISAIVRRRNEICVPITQVGFVESVRMATDFGSGTVFTPPSLTFTLKGDVK